MELPQSRPFGVDQGSKSTHNFLSLFTHSSPQQDPRPSPQDGCLKTHNFLQPQERKRKATTKEETDGERPPPPPPPPSVEQFLPGGIGSYIISHISYFNQRVQPKPEGSVFTGARSSSSVERNNENSNGTSLSQPPEVDSLLGKNVQLKRERQGRRRILWERGPMRLGRAGANGQRPWSGHRNHLRTTSLPIVKKNPSFVEMLNSAKSTPQDEELDDDDEFDIKKETSTANKVELRIDVDGNSFDPKANTPRSKHSATEQRRRSKINDRFQMLRDVIPHSDQKRDKSSFLLEVVEYIKFLQEKVQKYEGSYQEWNREVAKLMPSRFNQRSANFVEKNAPSSSLVPGSSHYTVDSDTSSATTLKAVDHHPGSINNAIPFPMYILPNLYAPTRDGSVVPQAPKQSSSDTDRPSLPPQIMSCEAGYFNSDVADASEMQKEQDLTIEGGTINISSVYSQGLFNTLTHALHSLGVDLSQARISVQIELGKQANRRATAPTSINKDVDIPINDMSTIDSRVSAAEDSEEATKKKLNAAKS